MSRGNFAYDSGYSERVVVTAFMVAISVMMIVVGWYLINFMHGETRTGAVVRVETVATSRGPEATVTLEDGSSYVLDTSRKLFGTSKEAPEEGMLIECQVSHFGDEMYSWEQLADPAGVGGAGAATIGEQ